MKSTAPITHGLIKAVHRRIVVLRLLESIALGCAAAAVAGLLLLPIIWWRGRSPLGMAEMLLGLGAICGLIRGAAARPTQLDTAAEADRQLGLHDLLGTVLLLCRGGDDDLTTPQWRASLLAISEIRCRDLRASTVIINRLGLRTWGGIGVLVAGLLTLSLLCAQPPDVRASARLDAALATMSAAPPDAQVNIGRSSESPERPPGSGGTDQDFHRDGGQSQSTVESWDSPGGDAPAHGSNGKGGVGSGMARTATAARMQMAGAHAGDPATGAVGPSAAGAGRGDPTAKGIGPASYSETSPDGPASSRIPPWQGPNWMTDSVAADQAIRAGRVPDSAADLVRDYFQRD
jgi:hypothetical protein